MSQTRVRRRSPFQTTVVPVAVALGYAVVAVVWAMASSWLPGGRWLAVHLFTLGVLSNLVLGFSVHFSRTLTRTGEDDAGRWRVVVLFNVGTVLVLVGLPGGLTWLVGLGATAATGAVIDSYVRLRGMRRRALGARFVWIVRAYERAHGAFVHGAIFGLLMGLGAVAGQWYVTARLAHLHVNVVGWGGLTLLATLVFFGPTMARARIRPGADDRAARALRAGASGLSVAVLALFASGVGATAGMGLRLLAAAGLAVFAWAAAAVCRPVVSAAVAGGGPVGTRWSLIAVCVWLPAALWVDVAVVATATWRLLDALGVALLVGVLLQAVAATLGYVAPMLRGHTKAHRDAVRARLSRGGRTRVVTYHVGTAAVVTAAVLGPATGPAGAILARSGWVLVGAVLASQAVAVLWPLGRTRPSPEVSA